MIQSSWGADFAAPHLADGLARSEARREGRDRFGRIVKAIRAKLRPRQVTQPVESLDAHLRRDIGLPETQPPGRPPELLQIQVLLSGGGRF